LKEIAKNYVSHKREIRWSDVSCANRNNCFFR